MRVSGTPAALGVLLLLAWSAPAASQTVSPPIHWFIAAGQSNMQSASARNWPADLPVNAKRLWSYGVDGTLMHPAREPNHRRGTGPDIAFADRLASLRPNWNIGVIPCSVAATGVDEWQRPREQDGTSPYSVCRTQWQAAVRKYGGVISGMIWSQGERETQRWSDPNTWRPLTKQFFLDVRADVGSGNLPIVYVQLGNPPERLTARRSNWSIVQAEQRRLQDELPSVAMVETADIPLPGIHFDVAGHIKIGTRAAEAMDKLLPQE